MMNMMEQGLDTNRGQAVYTRKTLALYDIVVLGLSNRFIWKCPTSRILDLYNRHASNNHLDVGVGTGWYLEHCRFPAGGVRLGLLDLNPDCLRRAASRVAHLEPEILQGDLLKPLTFRTPVFASASLSYLLHCLPGDIVSKAVLFDHLKPMMQPGGVVFGATLLSGGVERSGMARALMGLYNRKGIFSNSGDRLSDLEDQLRQRFRDVSIEVAGCAALFVARGYR